MKDTKKLVHNALLQLLEQQTITKISIRELCQIAGINRTTFYNHYGSQYDVLNEIAQEYLQNTSYAMQQFVEKGADFAGSLAAALQYMADHMAFSRLLMQQGQYDLIRSITTAIPAFDEMTKQHLPQEMDDGLKSAIAAFVQYGTVHLLEEWILGGCQKSPQEETELLLAAIGWMMKQEARYA